HTQRALGELLRLEISAAKLTPGPRDDGDSSALLRPAPLLRLVLSREDYGRYESEHRQAIQEALDSLYRDASAAWPPAVLAGDSEAARAALDNGIDALDHALRTRPEGGGSP